MDLLLNLRDPELGYRPFCVKRTTYFLRRGKTSSVEQMYAASGCIHPGTPEMNFLLPEENRKEDYIIIYTDFPLSMGKITEGKEYNGPDRVLWHEKEWRVVLLRDWIGVEVLFQVLAVKVDE